MRGLAPGLALCLALSLDPTAGAEEGRRAGPKTGSRHSVELRSQPGVEVLWEGVLLGETDTGGTLTIEGIPSGEYRLTLRRPGFRELDTRIAFGEGADASRTLLLEEIGSRHTSGTSARAGAETGSRGPEAAAARPAAGEEPRSPPSTAGAAADDVGADPAAEGGGPGIAADPMLATPASPAARSTFSPFLVAAVLATLAAGAAGARYLSRSRHAGPAPRPTSGPAPEDDDIPVFEAASPGTPGFLEDLKQRERAFGDPPEAPAGRRETIIEIEAVEVRPAESRSAEEQ